LERTLNFSDATPNIRTFPIFLIIGMKQYLVQNLYLYRVRMLSVDLVSIIDTHSGSFVT
jgi:hypothetical protein